jgi:glycerophosphoryl diester phosphodiesterase
MLCFGHRGARGHAPENTVLGVHKAIELGADWIEIDVYAVDDELVVIHDDRLERTTDGAGYVVEQTLEHLRALDAGDGQRIPTLGEIFDAAGKKVGINIELKGPGTAAPVVDLIRHRMRDGWPAQSVIVSSFDHRELAEARRLAPDIRRGALIVGLPVTNAAFAEDLGAWSVHPSIEFLDEAFIADAHDRGLNVIPFTVNHPDDIDRMFALGVDGLFTDYPDRVVERRARA